MKKSYFLAALAITCACRAVAIASQHDVILNLDSFRFAEQLIEQGHFVADNKGNWREHRASAAKENEFIRIRGIAEYAKWHLAIDPRHGENSKARYKFPFGDFTSIDRSGLIAIRSRAREYGYSDVENAAANLQRRLEQKASVPRAQSSESKLSQRWQSATSLPYAPRPVL
jgi:hypothetical protein